MVEVMRAPFACDATDASMLKQPLWSSTFLLADLAFYFEHRCSHRIRFMWASHRVHHASNAEYLDKNFGAVLLIWDHLFGTYQAERADITTAYGLTHPRSNNNPFVLAYEEFWDMFKEALRTKRIEYLVREPGWKPSP